MADEFRPNPNRPSYRGSSDTLDPRRCKAGVWSSDRLATYSQCRRKAVSDGWCKQHLPEAEAEREKAKNDKFNARMREDAVGWYGEGFMAALVKIRDGDNDPRETARIALKGCAYAQDETLADRGRG